MQSQTTPLLTVEDLARPEFQGRRVELVQGELVEMVPAQHDHGMAGANLTALLVMAIAKADPQRLQSVKIFSAETGFLVAQNPDTVLAPDYSILDVRRLGPERKGGYFVGAPDIAIEILSPSNARKEMMRKARLYLDAGASEVWLIDNKAKTLCVESDGSASPQVCRCGDTMRGSGALEGVELAIAEVFAGLP